MRLGKRNKEKTQGMDMEQFLSMPFGKKVQWLVQYYGVTAVVCVIAAYCVFNLLHSYLFPAPGPDRQVLILADEISTSDINLYQEQLCELTGKDILVEHFFASDVYGKASFSAKMGVDPIDLVIAPEEEMQAMEEAEAIRERHKINLGDLSIAVTNQAVQDEILDMMSEYFEEQFRGEKE